MVKFCDIKSSFMPEANVCLNYFTMKTTIFLMYMTDSLSFTKDVHNTFRAYGYFWEAWPPLHRQSLLDVIVLGTNI